MTGLPPWGARDTKFRRARDTFPIGISSLRCQRRLRAVSLVCSDAPESFIGFVCLLMAPAQER